MQRLAYLWLPVVAMLAIWGVYELSLFLNYSVLRASARSVLAAILIGFVALVLLDHVYGWVRSDLQGITSVLLGTTVFCVVAMSSQLANRLPIEAGITLMFLVCILSLGGTFLIQEYLPIPERLWIARPMILGTTLFAATYADAFGKTIVILAIGIGCSFGWVYSGRLRAAMRCRASGSG